MPSKNKKQQKFFGLVRALQRGEVSPHSVSDHIRKVANKISVKDASDFASSIAELRTKRAVLSMLKELREPMYLQEDEEDAKQEVKATEFKVHDNYEQFVNKHIGQTLTPHELESIDNFQEAKPTKISKSSIRYEKTDEFSNTIIITIKKMKDNNQFSYTSFTKYSNLKTKDDEVEPSIDNGETGAPPSEPQSDDSINDGKDDIIVSKSILFQDDIKGSSILSDFLKKLDL